MTDRICRKYYRKRFSGGRRTLGRVLDYIALRAVLLIAFYLFFKARLLEAWIVWLLASLSLTACALLIRVVREGMFARFVKREKARLADMLCLRKLMLLPTNEFLRLCDRVLAPGRIPCPLQCAEPADRDGVLRFVRASEGRPISVFSTAGYTKDAETFASACGMDIVLTPPDQLLAAAASSGLRPGESDIAAEIVKEQLAENQKRRQALAKPFSAVRSARYLIVAALLVLASFFVGYPLYYRMMAGLCMTLSFGSALLRQQRQAR